MLLAVMTLICVAGILGMTLFLRLWIGKDIGTPAAPIGVILLLGIFLNSLAYLPSMYLQATGRPNRNAQFHLIEIGPHVLFLFVGIYFLKLMGVALAMLFVSGFDAILLFWAADLQIWRHRHFRVASGFIVAALVSYLVFPALRWQSYIEYGLLSGACALWSLTVFRERQLTIREFFSLIGRRFRTS
jgi:O-antigen/teichoic acid export membrane protein